MGDKKQTCILVLGMHRSGTSALAGVLSLLDVYLGSSLMEANEGNKKGYFENTILYKINEKLLASIGSSWRDIFYCTYKLKTIDKRLLDELQQFLENEFEHSNTFLIKDPRLAYLFPIYEQVLKRLKIDIKIIIPYRNPIEVANSLQKRDKMSIEQGMLLWCYSFLLSEKFSRSYDRIFVDFDDLISNSIEIIEQISTKLSIDFMTKYYKQVEIIQAFLEPTLKHHNISLDNSTGNLPLIVEKILKHKYKFNSKKITKTFDVLYEEFFDYQKFFYNSDILYSFELLDNNKKQVEKQKVRNKQLEEQLSRQSAIIGTRD
ncbi:MAG: hypothetical protein U9N49_10590, partial [Campylobacterota bacterium]|nr:hypothetical protein [Campylobacterota bacterium]